MATEEKKEKTSIKLQDVAGDNGENIPDGKMDANHNVNNGYEDLSHNDLVSLDDADNQLSAREAKLWRYAALTAAWLSVIILLILGITSFGVTSVTKSSAAFGFGFDCILDVGTSAVVIWRFFGSVGTLYSADRERIALLLLGCLFIVASLSIFARSITDLISGQHPKHGAILFALATVSGATCTLLAVAKFIIAGKLNSRSIKTDGYSSLAGAITSFSILLATKVIEVNKDVWYLDAVIGISVGVLLLFYGVKVLIDVLHENQQADIICTRCRESDSTSRLNLTDIK